MDEYIDLDREFEVFNGAPDNEDSFDWSRHMGLGNSTKWGNLLKQFRCVILAEAGAGKTEELKHRAKILAQEGFFAFFIRIEDISNNFFEAFEVGDAQTFDIWKSSTQEAWFFLDSIDEARLENHRALERALRAFASATKPQARRMHIFLSSRPYAWRQKEDEALLDEILFFEAPQQDSEDIDQNQGKAKSALSVYELSPLDSSRIRNFAIARGAKDVDRLLLEAERLELQPLAERPFDLEAMLGKWGEDQELGGRKELISHNIDVRLRDAHSPYRKNSEGLSLPRAREGARRLAAAVILCGKSGISIPGAVTTGYEIDAEKVLQDWGNKKDIQSLLELGVFNDVIYGAVRFRQREFKDLLAAEWFLGILKEGRSRSAVEGLFIRSQYGELVIAPRLRSILSWLILEDDGLRKHVFSVSPHIAIEGGEPSLLPLPVRRQMLNDVVSEEAKMDRQHSSTDSIVRIARPDLAETVLELLEEYIGNDRAVFFLARFVWKAGLADCTELLVRVFEDPSRDTYSRIVAARAVMSCGSKRFQLRLWKALSDQGENISRRLFAEVVGGCFVNLESVKLILSLVGKLEPYEQHGDDGLNHALHGFVERIPEFEYATSAYALLVGLVGFLKRSPFVEKKHCKVSSEFSWLLGMADHIVNMLVRVRSSGALDEDALYVMQMLPALRGWQIDGRREFNGELHKLVPEWTELNDKLFWVCVDSARAKKIDSSEEPLIEIWDVMWPRHFWNFDESSFGRLIEYIDSKDHEDDQCIALSAATMILEEEKRPANMLLTLEEVVASSPILQNMLREKLKPRRKSPSDLQLEALDQESNQRRIEKLKTRNSWIAELRSEPDRLFKNKSIEQGEVTYDLIWLGRELFDHGIKTKRSVYSNWRLLTTEFGDPVAKAYKHALLKLWRLYTPPLYSEGCPSDESVNSALLLGLSGLEIESAENESFFKDLCEEDVRHALRYIVWELNGFPTWFESCFQARENLTLEAVKRELFWELDNCTGDKQSNYILNDISNYAPWLHVQLCADILDWLEVNPEKISGVREHFLDILIQGDAPDEAIAKLAKKQLEISNSAELKASWYAIIFNFASDSPVLELSNWLNNIEEKDAKLAAEIFITQLFGGRKYRSYSLRKDFRFRPQDLKKLYLLMFKYIRVDQDIERPSGKTYSPELRDDAQDARSALFSLIRNTPGKESYLIMKELSESHPDPNACSWMMHCAYERVEKDAEMEPWTEGQCYDFHQSQSIVPATNRQLYEVCLDKLTDLKGWVERGDDSPWKTWRRVENEVELRTLIRGNLAQRCNGQFVTAEEPEIANSQRMDIILQSNRVPNAVPIELKLLDKGWSGPKLCERLRNQLCGDYLRDEECRYGVMLLVSSDIAGKKRWLIDGKLQDFDQLEDALKIYWQKIAGQYPRINDIKVLTVDLAKRKLVSCS